MTQLPAVKPREVIRALEKVGFLLHHVKGSHYYMKHPDTGRRASVPYHDKDLKPGTLLAIVKQADLTREEFLNLL